MVAILSVYNKLLALKLQAASSIKVAIRIKLQSRIASWYKAPTCNYKTENSKRTRLFVSCKSYIVTEQFLQFYKSYE